VLVNLLPAIRDLYSRRPEYCHHESWELVHVLFSLGYVDDLADEGEIAAAVEVARGDYPQWGSAAWAAHLDGISIYPQPHQMHTN
jgi:hypothetical protein